MMTKSELTSDDLTLLGSFYSSEFALVVTRSRGIIELAPPKVVWPTLLMMTLTIAAIASASCWLLLTAVSGAPNPSKSDNALYVVVPIIGIIAVFGPLVGHWMRIRYMRSRSPLLQFDVKENRLMAIGGSLVFPKEDVFGILALGDSTGGETVSELQLVIGHGTPKTRHLLANSIEGNASQTFGRQLREFCDAAGIPGYIAEREGMFQRGNLIVRKYNV